MQDLVIVAITSRGLELGRRLQRALGQGTLVQAAKGSREILQQLHARGRPLVCVMGLGVVEQALGPLLAKGPEASPVIVVDESRQLAVSVLSAEGGALQLAEQVAATLGSVLRTDKVNGGPHFFAVEQIGRRWGWKLEQAQNIRSVTAAMQAGQPIAVYQDAGRTDWWESHGSWPLNFERVTGWPTEARWSGLIAISDRLLPAAPPPLDTSLLIYRPPTLTVGIGCRRGVTQAELESCIEQLFAHHRLSAACITALAAGSRKRDEGGLIDFAEEREIPLLTYARDKLHLVGPPERRGERISASAVCEPAAMLSAGVRELVVAKTTFRRLSLAVARRTRA